jgi:HPt (histidine-containing phosphotransfer) domain-containing protein
MDRKAALERTMGDEQFLSELLGVFIDGLPKVKKRLEDAIRHGNGDDIAAEAGCLAGAAGNLGATEICSVACNVDRAGREGDIAEADQQFRNLLREVGRFVSYVQSGEFNDFLC